MKKSYVLGGEIPSGLLKQQKGKCASCRLNFRPMNIIEVDHIIPKSEGGDNIYKNQQFLHRHCHGTKMDFSTFSYYNIKSPS